MQKENVMPSMQGGGNASAVPGFAKLTSPDVASAMADMATRFIVDYLRLGGTTVQREAFGGAVELAPSALLQPDDSPA
jgi:hypothetical protein